MELTAGNGDDFPDDFDDSLFEDAVREIFSNKGYTPEMLTEQAGANLIKETFKTFSNAVDKGVGLEETKPSPELISALKENAFVFSGFKTHAELEQAASMLTDENGNLKGFERFLNDVLSINKDYNHNYLRSEYNQAVQSAQMAAKWADFEKNKDFINLQYRTANDERVRASHRILHGTTLPVDDPFWKQYTPPNGWGCRCTVVAVLKDDYPVQDSHESIAKAESCFKTPKEKMFKENLAEKKRLFPSKHPYLPKSCNSCPLNNGKQLAGNGSKGDCGKGCKVFKDFKEKVENTVKEKNKIKEDRKKRKAEEKQQKQSMKMQTINTDIDKAKTQFSKLQPIESIPEMVEYCKKQYQQYDNNWEKLFFEPLNGGYIVCHKGHQYAHNEKGGEAEIKVAYLLARISAKCVELLPENGQGEGLPDLRFDGYTWDVKRIDGANAGSIEKVLKNAKKADRVIFYWEDETGQIDRIIEARNRSKTKLAIYYMNKDGRLTALK